MPVPRFPAALAVSFSLVSHAGPTDSRLLWVALVPAVGMVLVWPVGRLLQFLGRAWAGEPGRRQAVAACVGFGLLLNVASAYRSGLWADDLGLHVRSVRSVLSRLLWLSDLAILSTGLGLLLTVCYPPRLGTPATPTPLPKRRLALVLAAAVAWIAAAVGLFVTHERTAHYWDYTGYWLACSDFSGAMTESPKAAWQALVVTCGTSDYTLFPAVLPSVVMAVAGDSRLAYELAVGTVYGGAVVLAAMWAVTRVGTTAAVAGTAALAVTLPAVWDPTFRGYLDLGGVALALAAFGLYLARPPEDLRWPSVLALGAALAAVVLFRRWYSFWVVAFVAVALAEAAVTAVRRRAITVATWRPVVVAAGIAGLLFASIAWPTLRRIAATDYGDLYAGYRLDLDTGTRLGWLLRDIGGGYVAAFAVAAVAVIARPETRRAGLFATAMLPVVVAHFLRVQDMGPHHRLLLVPSALLVGGLALARLRPAGVGLVALLLAGGFAVGFVPALHPVRSALEPWTPRATAYPEVRDDIDELLALADDAHRASAARDTTFVVVASSLDLNPYHVRTVRRSLGLPRLGPCRQLRMAEVDKVDGFPDTFFECGVVVAACPGQTHLRPAEQVIVPALAGQLWDGRGLGAAFDRLPRVYELRNGVRAQVFVRRRPFRPAEVDDFCRLLREAHPGRPTVSDPRRPVVAAEGDGPGAGR